MRALMTSEAAQRKADEEVRRLTAEVGRLSEGQGAAEERLRAAEEGSRQLAAELDSARVSVFKAQEETHAVQQRASARQEQEEALARMQEATRQSEDRIQEAKHRSTLVRCEEAEARAREAAAREASANSLARRAEELRAEERTRNAALAEVVTVAAQREVAAGLAALRGEDGLGALRPQSVPAHRPAIARVGSPAWWENGPRSGASSGMPSTPQTPTQDFMSRVHSSPYASPRTPRRYESASSGMQRPPPARRIPESPHSVTASLLGSGSIYPADGKVPPSRVW